MGVNESIIEDCKLFINTKKEEEFKTFVLEVLESDIPGNPDWPTVFQAVYIHACLKKQKSIAEWLEHLFQKFDPIVQIAYRQVFFYGRWLLAKA